LEQWSDEIMLSLSHRITVFVRFINGWIVRSMKHFPLMKAFLLKYVKNEMNGEEDWSNV